VLGTVKDEPPAAVAQGSSPPLGQRLTDVLGGAAALVQNAVFLRRARLYQRSRRRAGGALRYRYNRTPIRRVHYNRNRASIFCSTASDSHVGTRPVNFSRGARGPDVLHTCRSAARELRNLTGFARVMSYRFLEDGSGCVIAKEKDAEIPTFLNHHYPVSDIPKQARELYVRNVVRVIPDVNYNPTPLVPQTCPAVGRPWI
jgi:hypothetical protein